MQELKNNNHYKEHIFIRYKLRFIFQYVESKVKILITRDFFTVFLVNYVYIKMYTKHLWMVIFAL